MPNTVGFCSRLRRLGAQFRQPLNRFAGLLLCNPQVVDGLQVEPKPGTVAKEVTQPQRRVGDDGAPAGR